MSKIDQNNKILPPLLEMKNISKSFPGVRALDNVSFKVAQGEVHALIGENGAGKSTLMKILAGAYSADSGEIILNKRKLHLKSPQQAIEEGISIIYQEFNLVPSLSVAENLFLGREPLVKKSNVINYSKLYSDTKKILNEIGLDINPKINVEDLSIAQQQMVEIAKATSRNSKIIAMDEPSATLTEHELERLFELIRKLKNNGVSIIYISHRLEEMFEIADRVTVLRDGLYIDTKNILDTNREEVIKMMVGRELGEAIPKKFAELGKTLLEIKNLSKKGVVENISFNVKAGEIVGLVGLVGAGRTETARLIFGADKKTTGDIFINGEKVNIKSPVDAISKGIGLVNEDRKAQGLVLGMSVKENISLAYLDKLSLLGFIKASDEKSESAKYVNDLQIKTPSIDQEVQNLSGGNQQKVVLAKWLITNPKILIFDEPTRGIDVGAKTEIYQLMNRLAEAGNAIIMISSELPEVLGMSDRIIVMHEGKIAGELSREEATQEKIMHLATGGV
ncbi:MAG: sugar ABC transporter ATP-binding protein [Armatimonadota bacterium]